MKIREGKIVHITVIDPVTWGKGSQLELHDNTTFKNK